MPALPSTIEVDFKSLPSASGSNVVASDESSVNESKRSSTTPEAVRRLLNPVPDDPPSHVHELAICKKRLEIQVHRG